MLLCWLVLILGFEFGMRTDSVKHVFNLVVTKKIRIYCYIFAWILSFLLFFGRINSFESWYWVMLALFLLPVLKFFLKLKRKSQIPERSLNFLDLILLNLKSGQSLRKSIVNAIDQENSWFKSFQLNLLRSFETGIINSTESDWFNSWSQEILQIEKSRNKITDQLEVLRRYSRQEQNFKSKIRNASSGPRAQLIVMSILFFALNILAVRNLQAPVLKSLLPAAWILFLIGVMAVFAILRSFKWKV